MTEAQQNDDEVIELPETVPAVPASQVVIPPSPPMPKPELSGECPWRFTSSHKETAIPPSPPMPKPELVGEMPPLKWRKKFMQRKLRRQGKNRLTRRSRTL